MARCALGRLLLGIACGCLAAAHVLSAEAFHEDQQEVESLALVQEQVTLHNHVSKDASSETLHGWGYSFASAAASPAAANVSSPGRVRREPFEKAIVLSIDPQKYEAARERLEAQGVRAEPFWGFNGKSPKDLAEATALLQKYNHTAELHSTVGNVFACMHMSPGTSPRVFSALRELVGKAVQGSPRNVEQLLQKDDHHCAPRIVAIAASHVRLWERLVGAGPASGAAAGSAEEEDDPWVLVMEDDAALCPGWRERMEAEVPLLPADADVVKLFFFGNWRKEDQLPDGPGGAPSPFLMGRDPMNTTGIAKAAVYQVLHGASLSSVPVAGFYAGTQAYLVRRRSAQKLLTQIRGKPFQDIDMTMMTSVKNYVWRRALGRNAPGGGDGARHASLMQVVGVCNRDPPKDWWF